MRKELHVGPFLVSELTLTPSGTFIILIPERVLFFQNSNPCFCNNFHLAGAEIPLRRKLTPGSKSKRRKLSSSGAQSEDEIDFDGDGDTESVKEEEECAFKSLYLVSRWQEDENTSEMLSVAVLLPSGIEAGDFHVRVMDGGKLLEVKVVWPMPLIDEQLLHRKWLVSNGTSGIEKYPENYGVPESA